MAPERSGGGAAQLTRRLRGMTKQYRPASGSTIGAPFRRLLTATRLTGSGLRISTGFAAVPCNTCHTMAIALCHGDKGDLAITTRLSHLKEWAQLWASASPKYRDDVGHGSPPACSISARAGDVSQGPWELTLPAIGHD